MAAATAIRTHWLMVGVQSHSARSATSSKNRVLKRRSSSASHAITANDVRLTVRFTQASGKVQRRLASAIACTMADAARIASST